MRSFFASTLVAASLLSPWLGQVSATESAAPTEVLDLTSSDFTSVTSAEPLMLVEFFAPWCGHCKSLAPHYDEASIELKKKGIKLAKVDCVDQAELCQANGVQGYPTLKVYKNGSASPYGGPRQADGIISYMVKQSLPAVSTVTYENYAEFVKSDKIVVMAFVPTTATEPAPAFSEVAEAHRDDYLFGITTDLAAIKEAGVTAPAIVLYKAFDEGRADMSSSVVATADVEQITKFLKAEAIPLFDEVSGDNFQTYAQSGLPLAYLFVDPEQSEANEKLIEDLKPIAKEHKGVVNFVWIDGAKFGEHGKSLALEPEWPALVIQNVQSQLKFPFDQSAKLDKKAVSAFVSKFVKGELSPKLKSAPVPESQDEKYFELVGSQFDEVVLDDEKDVFVQFSAPWCGHCKRLLPTWEILAEKYAAVKDKLVIAKMDATENDLPASAPFTISGFPTIKFKAAGTKEFIDYTGDRSLEDLLEFITTHAKNDLSLSSSSETEAEAPVVSEPASAGTPKHTQEAHDEL